MGENWKYEANQRLTIVKCHSPPLARGTLERGSQLGRGLSIVNGSHKKDEAEFRGSTPCQYCPHIWQEGH